MSWGFLHILRCFSPRKSKILSLFTCEISKPRSRGGAGGSEGKGRGKGRVKGRVKRWERFDLRERTVEIEGKYAGDSGKD